MNTISKRADVQLSDGSMIQMEYSAPARQQVNAGGKINFTDVFNTVKSLADDVQGIVKQAKARKTTVEFGVELAAESGKLTALVVKGSATASLKFTFEWENSKEQELSAS